jgi:hypothetical protein
MPRARERTATAATNGELARVRIASFRLIIRVVPVMTMAYGLCRFYALRAAALVFGSSGLSGLDVTLAIRVSFD